MSYKTSPRSDGAHCDRCGIMDCECELQQYRCPKCKTVVLRATSVWKTCNECLVSMVPYKPEMIWRLHIIK